MSVAIIGAGASGIVAIKECLDYSFKPVCYEIHEDLGGLWNISLPNSSAYYSTVINSSKEMMCMSDFPMPKEFPIFCPHDKVLEYFRLYVKHFNLEGYIKFRTKVNSITKSEDYEESGRWIVNVTQLTDNITYNKQFDFILLCVGHHHAAYRPQLAGQERFRGKLIHSQEYLKPIAYEGKQVVIVGVGNSGCDMAVDLSRVASKVYLSTRTGTWVKSRLFFKGLPMDMLLTTRFTNLRFINKIFKKILQFCLYLNVDLKLYGLAPNHGMSAAQPVTNDELIGKIATGKVEVRPNIVELTDTGVIFDDGTQVDADLIALCTGYNITFDCMSEDIIKVNNNEVNLYKYVFPPDLSKGTLAVIGCIQPAGGFPPLGELQARWTMEIFKGNISLPSNSEMWDDIDRKSIVIQTKYVASRRYSIRVDYSAYGNEIANIIGCNPSLYKILFTDPYLWFRLVFGPITPSCYRLNGPHSWIGSRTAIISAWDNVTYHPLRKHMPPQKIRKYYMKYFLMIILLFLIISYLFF